tara:strand:+ start:8180 stop:9067 length:888 start_codon:yes stop_codon:yes gene_type:complete
VRKIDFIIVGVARCGTTSLYNYLQQHPEIIMPFKKEPKFFSSINRKFPLNGPGDKIVEKEIIKNKNKYFNLFSKLDSSCLIGEASSDYFYFYKNAIPNIKKELGDVKIIICIRNPVERAFSAYNNLVRDSRENLSFEKGLEYEKSRIEENYDWMWHYKNGGLYSDGISAFKKEFSNVMVILNEDLDLNTDNVLKSVFSFLEVDNNIKISTSARFSVSGKPKNLFFKILSNRSGFIFVIRKYVLKFFNRKYLEFFAKYMFEKDKISYSTRIQLTKYFKSDIRKIEKILSVDLSSWK